jgi:hypothetical protein
MTKLKMIGSLSLAAALAFGHSMAFADADHDAFFHKMAKFGPDTVNTLHAVGADYKAKCGFEPTVPQYENIVANSPAYTYRLATTVLADGNISGWSPKDQAQYQKFIKAIDCSNI